MVKKTHKNNIFQDCNSMRGIPHWPLLWLALCEPPSPGTGRAVSIAAVHGNPASSSKCEWSKQQQLGRVLCSTGGVSKRVWASAVLIISFVFSLDFSDISYVFQVYLCFCVFVHLVFGTCQTPINPHPPYPTVLINILPSSSLLFFTRCSSTQLGGYNLHVIHVRTISS